MSMVSFFESNRYHHVACSTSSLSLQTLEAIQLSFKGTNFLNEKSNLAGSKHGSQTTLYCFKVGTLEPKEIQHSPPSPRDIPVLIFSQLLDYFLV